MCWVSWANWVGWVMGEFFSHKNAEILRNPVLMSMYFCHQIFFFFGKNVVLNLLLFVGFFLQKKPKLVDIFTN